MRAPALSGCLAAALASVLLAGCGGGSEHATDDEQSSLPGVPVTVRVTDPGEGDASVLAYDFEKGRPTHWVYTSDLDITVDGILADYPPFDVDFTTKVTGVTDDGATIRLTVDDISVRPGTLQSDLEGFLAGAEKMRGTYTVEKDGAVVASTLRLPKRLYPAVKIPLAPFADGSVLLTPLPTEAVATGGAWVAANSLNLARNTDIDQSITYALDGQDEQGLVVAARVSQYLEYRVDQGPGTGTTRGRLQIHAALDQLAQRTMSGTLVSHTQPVQGSGGPPFTIRNRISLAAADD